MGLGAARAAAAAGAHVIVAGRRARAARSDAEHERFEHIVLDVTDETAVEAAFDAIGELDHLLVTAAPPPGSWRPFLEQDVAGVQRYVHAKLLGSWACARYAAPHLRAGGSITFLTGCAAIRPRAGSSIVTATFAAVEALAQALALELGPLRVNTIRPGLVDSAMWDFLDAAARERLRSAARTRFPARRIGTIDDIGHAAVFLMTNPYTTGIVLEVSGGEPLVALEAP
jgi:NAD(P)-dependent dehydrogenase (short-subunit alcohol dehydrogenase family)